MAGVDRMTIEEVVRKVLLDDHSDVLRESVRWMVQEMMDAEVSDLIGAERGERNPEGRATHRNGYRPRRWDTLGWGDRVADPQAPPGQLFPVVPDAA